MSTPKKNDAESFRRASANRDAAARLAGAVAPEPQNAGAGIPTCITPSAISKAKAGDASNPFYRVLQWMHALEEAEGADGERKAELVITWLRAEKTRLWKDVEHDLDTLHRCEQRSDTREDVLQVEALQDPEKREKHAETVLEHKADALLLFAAYRREAIKRAVEQ